MKFTTTVKVNKLQALADKLKDRELTELRQDFLDIMNESYNRRFETDTDPEGRPWQVLSPATLAQKDGVEILEDSGLGRRESGYRLEGDRIVGELSPEYMVKHQTGEEENVPQRKILGMDDRAEYEIDQALKDYFTSIRISR